MALAIIRFRDSDSGNSRFDFDIGKNRYYVYAIGDKEVYGRSGLKFLKKPVFKSDLIGPLPERTMGHAVLSVPSEHIDNKNKFIQLMSYRTRDLEGPAISNIVKVPKPGPGLDVLPDLTFSMETKMENTRRFVENRPFTIREVKPYSRGMFLGVLTNLLPSIVPMVGGILKSVEGGKSGGGGPLDALLKTIAKPDTLKLLKDLIGQIVSAPSAAPSAAASYYENGNGLYPGSLSHTGPVYSEAAVAPALLAMLPALIPILKQVISPETIKGVLDAPNKATQTIINGIKDFAMIGEKMREAEREHLRKLNPGVDPTSVGELLAGMSLGLSHMKRELKYKRVESVHPGFDEVQTQDIYGQTKVLYRYGQKLVFPLTLETPRTIKKAVLQFIVKDAETLEILIEKKQRIESATSEGRFASPALNETEIRQLRPNQDYLVCAALVWKNKAGKQRGAPISQKITLAADYSFDRIEESNQLIPLDDATRFRDYWHKVMQVPFSDELKRANYDCRYYYILKGARNNNARLETKTRIRNRERKGLEGDLKSGYEMSPDQLNRLIPHIAPGHPQLSEAELMPLRSADFSERINQAARYTAKLRGRAGDTAMLWVYPSVKIQKVVLKKISEVNANGNITGLMEHAVYFPLPAIVHFIGVRTK